LSVALVAAALGACAPTVTELETTDAGANAPASSDPAEAVPLFPEGEVDHERFVSPPLDPARLAPVAGDGPLAIVATVGQIADLARRIGGDRVAVKQLVPGRDDPHLYVPAPPDVAALSEADLVLYNGLFLEGQMGETFEQMGRIGIPTLAVTAGFETNVLLEREYSAGRFVTDPHVWFDPDLWQHAADNITLALGALDPEGAAGYEAANIELGAQLEALTAWGQAAVETLPEAQRVLVTSHDAFGYFGRRFGLEVRGLQGLSTEAEAGTADVEQLVRFIIDREVPAVFVEASVNPKALRAVVEAVTAADVKVQVGGELFSDTPGDLGTPEGTYPGMVLWNLATLVSALGGEASELPPLPAALSMDPPWDHQALIDVAVEEARR
jgi:manganese/zinc/iron transport system substrate-binding protein